MSKRPKDPGGITQREQIRILLLSDDGMMGLTTAQISARLGIPMKQVGNLLTKMKDAVICGSVRPEETIKGRRAYLYTIKRHDLI